MLCPRCGTKLGAGVTFCFNCNSDLRQVAVTGAARLRAAQQAATTSDTDTVNGALPVFPLSRPVIWLLNILTTPIAGAVLYYAWRRRYPRAARYANVASIVSFLLWVGAAAAAVAYLPRGPMTREDTVRLSASQYYSLTLQKVRGTTYELEATAPEAGILVGCVNGAALPPQVLLTASGIQGVANSKRVPGRELGRVTGPIADPRLECAIANPNPSDVNVRYKLAVR